MAIKRFFALALAVVMVFSLGVSALATDEPVKKAIDLTAAEDCTGDNWTWSSATKTLSLNGAVIDSSTYC